MIWGKKYSHNTEHIWFAWYPVHLNNGKWAWWEKVIVQETKIQTRFYECKELKDEQK